MNGFLRFVRLVVLIGLLSLVSFVEGQSDQLSGEVAGYRILATYNSEDVACRQPNITHVILQAPQPTVEAFLAEVNFAAAVAGLQPQIATSRRLEVEFVGPATDPSQALSGLQRWNEALRGASCEQALAPQLWGNDGDEVALVSPIQGYAIYEDTDAATITDDNAQRAVLRGPTTIGSPASGVFLLNNVRTDTGYFLQNGFYFRNGVGNIVWTSDTQNSVPVNYPTSVISYVGGQDFWFVITYTNNVWWLCALNTSNVSTYTCQADTQATGTTVAGDINSAVFLENLNADSNWYSGFSGTWTAHAAAIYRNGFAQNWGTQHLHTAHACSTSYPTSNAMAGTLVSGGTGTFNLAGIPLYC